MCRHLRRHQLRPFRTGRPSAFDRGDFVVLAKLSLATAALLGAAAIADGLTMLVSPHGWYLGVPGVPMSGPFNQHFVRDIGVVFVLVGSAFVGGIAAPPHRALLWSAATAWL